MGGRLDSVTQLVKLAAAGDQSALERLVTVLYDELRSIARRRRAQWEGDETLSATVLVNEAYMRLAGQDDAEWTDRAHFMAVASRAMRQVLIDYSRRGGAKKRGGGWDRVTFHKVDELLPGLADQPEGQAESLLELDACLKRLEVENPRYSQIVECRFFGGMTIEETAVALGVSTATVKRGWRLARAWLHREMSTP